MKHLKYFSIFLSLVLALVFVMPALADSHDDEGTDIVLCGLIAFVDDDIVITVDADDDGLVSDEEFADGQEVIVAPASSFNPSAYEDGDEICLSGALLESGTFQGSELVADEDDDGFGSHVDCDDTDASVNPDAEEIDNDGIDSNCDGEDNNPVDADGDGYDASVDCNDDDPDVNPGAEEIDNDGIDSNCDGEDNNPVEEEEQEDSNCRETHPVAEALSEEYGVSVSEIMATHCAGVGFGIIARELGDGESLGTVMGNAPTAEEREAIRAEREAEREARRAEREAARAERQAGKGNGNGGNGNGGNGNGNGNGGNGNGQGNGNANANAGGQGNGKGKGK